MRYGIGVRVTNSQDGSVIERTFDKFPIRVGRSALNDLQIDQPFVSEFHAVLESHDGRLMLRDLGSTNGTLLRSIGRVSPNQVVNLAEHNYEFAIVALIFQTYTVKLEDVPTSRVRPLAVTNFMAAHAAAQGGPKPPGMVINTDVTRHISDYAEYRDAWKALMQSLQNSVTDMAPEARANAIRDYVGAMPTLANEPDFQRLAASAGVKLGGTSSATTREEAVALQGVKELAAEWVKGQNPETAEQVVNFLNKLKTLLEVFFKSFIPLRDGYRQFETDMELGRRGPRQGAVELAKTPEELASGLLDWRRPESGEAANIESTFADLMIHQVAMLNGVMNGVKQLLEELSPGAVERTLDDPRTRKPDGLAMGPFRFKALWKLYEQRHGDLVAEDRHVFSLLFGKQFAEAYSRFQGQRAVGPRQTVLHRGGQGTPEG